MNNIDLSKLNWAQGLSRLYNAIWGINLAYWLLQCIGREFIDLVGVLILAGGMPYLLKQIILWVTKGFVE